MKDHHISWRITRDVFAEAHHLCMYRCKLKSRVGLGVGLHDEPPGAFRFKLFDDDYELYYEGWCTDESFVPLNWAMADSGCTSIWYYDKRTQKYEQL